MNPRRPRSHPPGAPPGAMRHAAPRDRELPCGQRRVLVPAHLRAHPELDLSPRERQRPGPAEVRGPAISRRSWTMSTRCSPPAAPPFMTSYGLPTAGPAPTCVTTWTAARRDAARRRRHHVPAPHQPDQLAPGGRPQGQVHPRRLPRQGRARRPQRAARRRPGDPPSVPGRSAGPRCGPRHNTALVFGPSQPHQRAPAHAERK